MIDRRTFFEVQLGGFLKVGDRFFDGFTLAHRADFRAFGDVEVPFLVHDRGVCASRHIAKHS